MTALRIGFAGVAHSHPFSDAANLGARGARIAGVWDADDADRRDDFAERFGAPRVASLGGLLGLRPHLVVATPRTDRAADVVAACRAAGIPVFANKTIAADKGGLDAFAAQARGARCFTSSVLRFAPAVVALRDRLANTVVHALDVHVQHDIAGFVGGWQDDAHGAGGTLVNVGVHAWEMLDVLLPGALATILSVRSFAAGGSETASETGATVHAVQDGTAVSVTISGIPGDDRYSVRAVCDDGMHEEVLPVTPEGLGYHGLADRLIEFANGTPSPVDWSRTYAVYANALACALAARSATEES